MKVFIIIIMILCMSQTNVLAQQSQPTVPTNVVPTPLGKYQPPPDPPAISNLEPSNETVAANKAHEIWRKSAYEQRTEAFRWQLISSKVVFWMVLFIVCIGLYFSWLQLKHSLELSEHPAQSTAEAPEIHELKLSLQGIEVKSSVVGLIILVISFGFFYLYLDRIYPITEVTSRTISSDSVPSGQINSN